MEIMSRRKRNEWSSVSTVSGNLTFSPHINLEGVYGMGTEHSSRVI